MRMPAVVLTALYAISAYGGRLDPDIERAAVAHARQLPASHLDPALPAERLGRWLPWAVAAEVEWFISDCDLRSHGRLSPEETPLCVGARLGQPAPWELRLHLVVGDWARGLSGTPRVLNSFVACGAMGAESRGGNSIQTLDRLADLPALAARLWDTCPERK